MLSKLVYSQRWLIFGILNVKLVTASGGIFGAVFALICGNTENAENSTAWILPFTSGSFLYIALVNILPEIHTEKDFRSSLKQIFSLFLGIFTIYLISFIMQILFGNYSSRIILEQCQLSSIFEMEYNRYCTYLSVSYIKDCKCIYPCHVVILVLLSRFGSVFRY